MIRLISVLALALAVPQLAVAQTCTPACRQGYACVQGVCVQACNPACPPGTVCVDGVRCDPVPAQCNPPCPAGTTCVDGIRCDPVAAQCNPPCRQGYTCVQGQCQSSQPPSPTPPPAQPATPPPAASGDEPAEDDGQEVPLNTLLKLMLGFGGEATGEGEGLEGSADLIATIGFGLENHWYVVEAPFGVSVGLLAAALFWNTDTASDADIGRSYLVDIDLVPRVHYRVLPTLFVYGGLPVGATVSILNSDSVTGDASVGFGFNIGFVAGAQLALDSIGVFAELGYHFHKFNNSIDTPLGEVDLTTSFGQFVLNLGFAF